MHPVIVGKRALPAVSVDGAGAAESVRLLGRPGDVLVVVSTAGDPVAGDLVARAEAWGLTSLWLGAGRRPETRETAPAPTTSSGSTARRRRGRRARGTSSSSTTCCGS